MITERGHGEIQELLGAYALDAVEPHERLALDAHLRDCRSCRAEVAHHRETAAMLAASAEPAPEELWSRIDAAIELEPDRLATVVPLARPRRGLWLRAAAAAAVAAVVGTLGLTVFRQEERLDQLATAIGEERVVRAANDALLDPRGHVLQLRGEAGTVDVVMLPDGTGYVVRDTLPPLPSDRTYQLWAVEEDSAVSAGVLGPDPDVSRFSVEPTIELLAITAEPGSGSRTPTMDPLATGELSWA